jgi:hypothetical protein
VRGRSEGRRGDPWHVFPNGRDVASSFSTCVTQRRQHARLQRNGRFNSSSRAKAKSALRTGQATTWREHEHSPFSSF